MKQKKIIFTNNKNQTISAGSFLCEDGCIVYKIVRKNDANYFLDYNEEDNIFTVVTNKSAHVADIEQYVKSNYKWVLNTWKKIDNPDPWWILGKQINVKTVIGDKTSVDYQPDLITVYIKNKKQYRDVCKSFLKQEATKYLVNRANEILNKLKKQVKDIQIKWLKWAYGKCSSDKVLEFSASLIQYEPYLIDSVIYHEIAHLTYMNHKKEFHDLLEVYFPNHRQVKKQLDHWNITHHIW